jgi:hypothetical protein
MSGRLICHLSPLLANVMSSTTPPPDSSSLLSPGTPIHPRNCATGRFGDKPSNYEDRDMTAKRLAYGMGPFFVGPMPVAAFLESFMPPATGTPQFKFEMFNDLIAILNKDENRWYEVFVSSGPCRPPLLFLRQTLLPDRHYYSASQKTSCNRYIPQARQ